MHHYRKLSDASADSGYSESSDNSIRQPPSFTAMASSNPPRWSNSTDGPHDRLNVNRLREAYISLYERDHCDLQQGIESLSRLINTFEEDFRRATEDTRDAGVLGIAGGVTMIAGLALAPFTLGASAVVAGAGIGLALCGGISGGLMNLKKSYKQKKLSENVKNRLEEFQNKIIPMTDIMKVFCLNTNEILSVTNKPECNISVVSKCVSGVSEVLRIIRIDDIGEVAAQMSKTVRLAGTLSGIFAGVGLVLDFLSVMEDNKTLDDMEKLAQNGQISESEIKSKAVKFIVEMREAIHRLQNIMDELKKTKDSFTSSHFHQIKQSTDYAYVACCPGGGLRAQNIWPEPRVLSIQSTFYVYKVDHLWTY